MQRITSFLAVSILVVAALTGCATMPAGQGSGLTPPKVELERVEVASYFPYAPPPARVPLVLAFVFNITNPNDFKVTLEDLKFTYSFEGGPGAFFPLNTPIVYETTSIPAKTTNQLRVVSVLDSAVVPGTLAVSAGFRVQALGLKGPDMVKEWWEKIGDFAFGIQVTEGVADFKSERGGVLVFFQGQFPKK